MITAPDITQHTVPAGITLGGTYRPLFARIPTHRYVLIEGGRGSAKSWHAAMALLNLTYESGHVILYTRWTMTSAEISIIPEFKEKIELLGAEDDFDIGADEITNHITGSKILFRGIKTSQGTQTANLKSIHGVTVWVLDEAEEMPDEKTFDKIDLSIRTKLRPNRVWVILNPPTEDHWICKRWHRKPLTVAEDAKACASGIRGCVHSPDTLYIHGAWEDNRHNLSAEWIQQAEKMRVENPKRYANVFAGLYSKHSLGGRLWSEAELNRSRVGKAPDGLVRVVVGVDPAVTDPATDGNDTTDEVGIVVVGLDRDKKCYVLEDLSGRYKPLQWATLAANAAKRWNGQIVAEKNQGGNLVRTTIHTVDKTAPVIDVTAVRDKLSRASPVYALYQNAQVFHVGEHPMLERQMLAFNPDVDEEYDDRVDALVWAVRKLAIDAPEVYVV